MEKLTLFTVETSQAQQQAAQQMLQHLQTKHFFSGTQNFLLLSGGSCIDVVAQLLALLPADATLAHTTVGLADERWVPSGSSDSNELQLRQKGVISALEERGAQFVSMLGAASDPRQAAELLSDSYREYLSNSEQSILLAGIGEDGHTLGILPDPNSESFLTKFSGESLVTYYELAEHQINPFRQRLTTTFSAVSKLTTTFIFAVGESKRAALTHLYKKDTTITQVPALGLYLSEHEPILFTDLSL